MDTYRFDLVNVARQVLANHAATLHQRLVRAHRAADAAAFRLASDDYLQLIRDLEELLATRSEFLLGCWLADARRWGDTEQEKCRCLWNARRVLTLWGEGPAIDDYAGKQWAGMLSGYYLPRWQQYLEHTANAIERAEPVDTQRLDSELRSWSRTWSDDDAQYATEPSGDSIAVAARLWEKYGIPISQPDAVSLTTGKPASCSHSLPAFPAHLANDGWSNNTDQFWATDSHAHAEPAWWCVDLQQVTPVGRVVVVGFYGDSRHYGFSVECSADGQQWNLVADLRDNQEPSTSAGYVCRFAPQLARYIRVTQTANSANSGRHLVEVMAYEQ